MSTAASQAKAPTTEVNPETAGESLYATGAHIYDALTPGNDLEISTLVAQTQGAQRVLDMGCGSGRLSIPLLSIASEVVALDDSEAMLQLLARRQATLPRRLRDRLHPVQQDMAALNLAGSFDVILCGATNITLLNADQRAGAFAGVVRHLAPRGRFLLTILEVSANHEDKAAEAVHEVTDAFGRRWSCAFRQTAAADGLHRDVRIVVNSLDDETRPGTTYTSSPAILHEEDVTDELAAAGLIVSRRSVIGDIPAGRVILLEATGADA